MISRMPSIEAGADRPTCRLRRLLFLDIGGVLAFAQRQEFTSDCAGELKRLCRDVPDLQLVLSSAWRLSTHGRRALRREFSRHALDFDRIAGLTPDFSEYFEPTFRRLRGWEIRGWLLNQKFYCGVPESAPSVRYAILDDQCDEIVADHPRETVFATSCRQGLTVAIADNLIAYFRSGFRNR